MSALSGQVAIVTGAGTGIGREAARLLAAEGAHVVLTGRRQAPLDAVATEIGRAGGRATARRLGVGGAAAARAPGGGGGGPPRSGSAGRCRRTRPRARR